MLYISQECFVYAIQGCHVMETVPIHSLEIPVPKLAAYRTTDAHSLIETGVIALAICTEMVIASAVESSRTVGVQILQMGHITG